MYSINMIKCHGNFVLRYSAFISCQSSKGMPGLIECQVGDMGDIPKFLHTDGKRRIQAVMTAVF